LAGWERSTWLAVGNVCWRIETLPVVKNCKYESLLFANKSFLVETVLALVALGNTIALSRAEHSGGRISAARMLCTGPSVSFLGLFCDVVPDCA
jgi:hypothetical protein